MILAAIELPTPGILRSAAASSVLDVAAEPGDGLRGLLVVASAERIAARDLQQIGVLLQECRDCLVCLRHLRAGPRTAVPAR